MHSLGEAQFRDSDHDSRIDALDCWTESARSKLVLNKKVELAIMKTIVLDEKFRHCLHRQWRSCYHWWQPENLGVSGHLKLPIEGG